MNQERLEAWIGAPHDRALTGMSHTYLFSDLDLPAEFNATVVKRSWIVLGASGLFLALGLLVIYVPLVRRPSWILVLSILVLATSLVFSEIAPLLIQASLLGLLLGGLAVWLRSALSVTTAPARDSSTVTSVESTHSRSYGSRLSAQLGSGASPTRSVGLQLSDIRE